jgi:D-alanyl-lipoteichoic acid biosynthesis protein dltD
MDKFKAFIFSIVVIVVIYLGVDSYLNNKLKVVNNSIRYNRSNEKFSSAETIKKNIAENTIILLGSSELSNYMVEEQHPSKLLDYSDLNMILIGAGNYQSLIHIMNLGAIANEKKFKNNKFVLILSPQWFDQDGLEKEAFVARYSEEIMINFLKNKDISDENKEYVINRAQELTQDNQIYQKDLKFFKKAYLKNKIMYRIYSEFYLKLLVVKNKFKFFKIYERNNEKNNKKFEGFNIEVELEKAQETAGKLVTNNPYGIYDEYYDKYIKENISAYFNSELEKDYLESPEYEDLKMFIKIAKELNVDVAIVNIPLNGLWVEYTGFKRENINKFNQKIKEICDIEGVTYIDFSQNIDEKYFLRDTMHLGWKGWVRLIDEVIKFNNK